MPLGVSGNRYRPVVNHPQLTSGNLLKTLKDFDGVAVTAGCGLFLLFEHWGRIPPPPAWMIGLVWFGFLLFGSVLALKLIELNCLRHTTVRALDETRYPVS
jgi:hypothetical protein